jgi:hypothetical protein
MGRPISRVDLEEGKPSTPRAAPWSARLLPPTPPTTTSLLSRSDQSPRPNQRSQISRPRCGDEREAAARERLILCIEAAAAAGRRCRRRSAAMRPPPSSASSAPPPRSSSHVTISSSHSFATSPQLALFRFLFSLSRGVRPPIRWDRQCSLGLDPRFTAASSCSDRISATRPPLIRSVKDG